MKRKNSYAVLIVLAIFAVFIYFSFFTTPSVKGISDNNMWKVTYKKNKEEFDGVRGWKASVKQINKTKVKVKKIEFLENNKELAEKKEFHNEKDIDGTEYSLHPFSYPDLYLGDAPKKNYTYYIRITWEDNKGKTHTDKIELK